MSANWRAIIVHSKTTQNGKKLNYLVNMVEKELTWHLIEILNTSQTYMTKIRMNQISYLNITLRIFK